MPTLNKELILKVADEIEKDGPNVPKFNMAVFIDFPERLAGKNLADIQVCQTAACVAGHVSLLHCPHPARLTLGQMDALDHEERAKDAMGLSCEQAEALFAPDGYELGGQLYPRKRAATVLRHLVETDGEVEWDGRKRRRHKARARDEGDGT